MKLTKTDRIVVWMDGWAYSYSIVPKVIHCIAHFGKHLAIGCVGTIDILIA